MFREVCSMRWSDAQNGRPRARARASGVPLLLFFSRLRFGPSRRRPLVSLGPCKDEPGLDYSTVYQSGKGFSPVSRIPFPHIPPRAISRPESTQNRTTLSHPMVGYDEASNYAGSSTGSTRTSHPAGDSRRRERTSPDTHRSRTPIRTTRTVYRVRRPRSPSESSPRRSPDPEVQVIDVSPPPPAPPRFTQPTSTQYPPQRPFTQPTSTQYPPQRPFTQPTSASRPPPRNQFSVPVPTVTVGTLEYPYHRTVSVREAYPEAFPPPPPPPPPLPPPRAPSDDDEEVEAPRNGAEIARDVMRTTLGSSSSGVIRTGSGLALERKPRRSREAPS